MVVEDVRERSVARLLRDERQAARVSARQRHLVVGGVCEQGVGGVGEQRVGGVGEQAGGVGEQRVGGVGEQGVGGVGEQRVGGIGEQRVVGVGGQRVAGKVEGSREMGRAERGRVEKRV